jgi:hypothetical protein
LTKAVSLNPNALDFWYELALVMDALGVDNLTVTSPRPYGSFGPGVGESLEKTRDSARLRGD